MNNSKSFKKSKALSVCDKLEESIQESLLKAEALCQSISKQTFEGKLLSEAGCMQKREEFNC